MHKARTPWLYPPAGHYISALQSNENLVSVSLIFALGFTVSDCLLVKGNETKVRDILRLKYTY